MNISNCYPNPREERRTGSHSRIQFHNATIDRIKFPKESLHECLNEGFEPLAVLTQDVTAQLRYSLRVLKIPLASTGVIKSIDIVQNIKSEVYGMTFGRKSLIFSLATGAKYNGIVLNGRQKHYIPRYHSDVFSQTFVDANDSTLLSGCRNGNLFAMDMRMPNKSNAIRYPIFTVPDPGGSIIWMKPLIYSNDRDIIVCNTSIGKRPTETLRRLDRRMMKKPVICYSGHCMSHRPVNVPDVDCHERTMFGYGTDGILRQWDIDTGVLFQSRKIRDLYDEEICTKSNVSCFCAGEQVGVSADLNVAIISRISKGVILGSSLFSDQKPSNFV